MRRLLVALIAAGLLALALAAGTVLALRPRPLEVAQQGVVLADVTVINPGRSARAHQTIRVDGSSIRSISDYAESGGVGAEARSYAGSFVLPGLIDMHVHHPVGSLASDIELFGLLHLAHGVTAVRDCGSIDGSVLDTRARIAAGELVGPRIFACGPLIDGEPPFWPGAEVARDAAEAERIAERAVASGVDCLKAYGNLSEEALSGLRRAAKRHRLPLVGHVPVRVPIEQAGIDDVQHLTGVPAARSSLPAGLIEGILKGWDTIGDDRVDFVARISLEQRVAHTPTLVVIDKLLRLVDYQALLQEPAARMLPRYYRELIWKPGGMAGWSVPRLQDTTRAGIRRNVCAAVRRLHFAGVVLHVGSDSLNPFVVPGVAMHEELQRLAECGFTPEQVWEAATRRNGAALLEPDLGVLQAGAPADLLVFGRDPTSDLSALSTLRAVVANGRLYPRPLLDDAVARYRRHHDGWLYDRLSMFLLRLFAGAAASPAG